MDELTLRHGQLANGVRYILAPRRDQAGRAALRLRIKCGCLDERDEEQGLAHVLEHMAYSSSLSNARERSLSFKRIAELNGQTANAHTSWSDTIYQASLMELTAEGVASAIESAKHVAAGPVMRRACFERERAVVLAEIRQKTSPQMEADKAQMGFWFAGRLAGERLPIGAEGILRDAHFDQACRLRDRCYQPERALLVLVGDFDLSRTEGLIEKTFGDWPAGSAIHGAPSPAHASSALASATVTCLGASPSVSLVWPGPTTTRDWNVEDFTRGLALTIGFRIFRRSLSSAQECLRGGLIRPDVGLVAAGAAGAMSVIRSACPPDGLDRALEHLELAHTKLIRKGLPVEELASQRLASLNAYAKRLEAHKTATCENYADRILEVLNGGDVYPGEKVLGAIAAERIPLITAEDIAAALAQAFRGPPRALRITPSALPARAVGAGLVKPLSPFAPPSAGDSRTWSFLTAKARTRPIRRQHVEALGATLCTFDNGLRLTVRPLANVADILVAIRFGRGRAGLLEGHMLHEWALPVMFAGGLSGATVNDITAALSGRHYSGTLTAADTAFQAYGSTSASDLEVQLQFFAAHFADAAWRVEALDHIRAEAVPRIEALAMTALDVFRRDLPWIVRGGDQRWRHPTPHEARSARLDETRAQMDLAIARDPVEITVVGDIGAQQVIDLVGAVFGGMTFQSGDVEPRPHYALSLPSGAHSIKRDHSGDPRQCLVGAGWTIPGPYADHELARHAALVDRVLKGRALEAVRDYNHASYAVNSRVHQSRFLENFGYLMLYAEVDGNGGTAAGQAFEEVARGLFRTGVTHDEFEHVRSCQVQAVARAVQSPAYWLAQLSGVHDDPRRLSDLCAQDQWLRNATREGLSAACERFHEPPSWRVEVKAAGGA